MKKILLTGFKGYNNSTQNLLKNISFDKFYFSNNFNTIKKEVINLNIKQYDYIICFGQKPVIKKIYIELVAYSFTTTYNTNFPYEIFINSLKLEEYKLSYNAGNYFCNYVYFNILKEVNENNLNTKVIFIHIPKNKNIDNIKYLENKINKLLQILVETKNI